MEAVTPFVTDWDFTKEPNPPGWKPLADILCEPIGNPMTKPRIRKEQSLLCEYRTVINSYPPPTRHFIGPIELEKLRAVRDKYLLLESAIWTLNSIANANSYPRPSAFSTVFITSVPLVIDDTTGKLLPASPLMDILAEVDCRRIRRCLICRKLFWAGRLDKVCCTEKCSRVQRAREWRKAHSEG